MTIVRCYMVISFAFKVDKMCVYDVTCEGFVTQDEIYLVFTEKKYFFFLVYTDNRKYRT